VWGNAEYLPTLAEVFEQGREDCDGRAVVAASLLRRMGHDAWLVTDLLHMWVETPKGETMSPTGGEKTFVGTESGTAAKASFRLVSNIARGLSYGVAVFPLLREMLILAALCVVLVQPRSPRWRRVAGCLVLVIALGLLRYGGRDAALSSDAYAVVATWGGLAAIAAGVVLLVIRGGDPPSRQPLPESPAADDAHPG
jgi:hypothetical protein